MDAEEKIEQFKEFFEKYYLSKLAENVRLGKKRITISFKALQEFDPSLADDLLDYPEDTLRAAELSIEDFDLPGDIKNFKVRVRGDLPATNKMRVRDLRSDCLNKLVMVEGSIETKTDVEVRMTSSRFECPSCGNVINVLQIGETMQEPTKCSCGRKGKFKLLSQVLIDCFILRVQELTTAQRYGSDMKVKSVLCEGDLTDIMIEEKLVEGMKVKVTGIYKGKMMIKGGEKQTKLMTYIDANYIQISEESFYDIELNEKDIKEIKKFVSDHKENLIETIAEGLFQGIHGYYKIKEALVLQAFGGVSDYKAIPHIRGDPHILLIGDPGESKSVFLEFVHSFSPKNVLVVGKSVSAVGLSGATIKDELSGSWVLKPGAIPLANNGIILIDELDKMKPEDRDILHEPMAQSTISISKANLPDRKMLARESFLVSMNPKNGYFNEFDAIYDQIDLPPTLVNRFDLPFIMKKNRFKSEEVKKSEKEKAKIMMTRSRPQLQEKLLEFHMFMRKYIAYARQNIHPKFDKDLEEEYIPDKYANFDYESKSGRPGKIDFPITPRHLEIIKRLSEARRKIFLDEHCTREDVDYAIAKIKGSLEDIAMDIETGTLDVEYIADGVSKKRKQLITAFDEICEKLELPNKDIMLDDFIKESVALGATGDIIEECLERKKTSGDIFWPRTGKVFRRI